MVSAAAALGSIGTVPARAAERFAPPVSVFSKVYQELKLGFEDAAAVTAESGLDGIDCPVRPGGEIPPERAADEMPRYAEALKKHNVQMLLLTTGIQNPSSPHAEAILRTAKRLGIRYYRLGVWQHKAGDPSEKLVAEVRAQLKDLAAMNREIGVCALLQNHSPGGRKYAGGDLGEAYQIVKDFNPDQIGVTFDIGHALIVHGDEWSRHFERLKSHLRIAYVKDPSPAGRFVPFGEGRIPQTDFFKRLKAMGYSAPFSMHIEFEWGKNRAALVSALQRSQRVVRSWLAAA